MDVTPEMGPLEIAPGTHFDDGSDFEGGMRVPSSMYARYAGRLEPRMPTRGDVSIRTGLTIHRGTANTSQHRRPVMIVGVIGARYETFADHKLTVTGSYFESLPLEVRRHLDRCTVADVLEPIVQDYALDFLLEEG